MIPSLRPVSSERDPSFFLFPLPLLPTLVDGDSEEIVETVGLCVDPPTVSTELAHDSRVNDIMSKDSWNIHRLGWMSDTGSSVIGLRAINRGSSSLIGFTILDLLRNLSITRCNHVWSTDIRMTRGFMCRVTIVDWHSRYVLAWHGLTVIQHPGWALLPSGSSASFATKPARELQHRPRCSVHYRGVGLHLGDSRGSHQHG